MRAHPRVSADTPPLMAKMARQVALWIVSLFVCPIIGLAAPPEILAVPAMVPFMESQGELLVRFEQPLKDAQERQLRFDLQIGKDFQTQAVASSHVDRQGQRWLHVQFKTASLPLGPSTLSVRVSLSSKESDSILATAAVKVVRAPPSPRAVVVDNFKGYVTLPGRGGKVPSPLPFFGFGPYTYGVTTDVERSVPESEAQFGMNLMLPYLSEASGHSNETWTTILNYLDRCTQLGIYVHYALNALAVLPSSQHKQDLITQEVKTVMNHPAVVAYYLADEPGGQGIDPHLLEEAYDTVKSVDPHKPISMVFCCVNPAGYINSYDIGMADPYPIPNESPVLILGSTSSLAKTGKPYFIVIQSFGGGEAWERTPTPAEERVMTYLAVITGAVGIQYFIRSPHAFPYSPTSWSECRRLSLEIRELSSAILSGSPSFNVSTAPLPSPVFATGWGERLKDTYVIAAVNADKKPVNVTLTAPQAYTGMAHVIFEDRYVAVSNGSIIDVIPAYGSVVYRFPPIEQPSADSNLIRNPSFEQIASVGAPDGNYISVPNDLGSTFLADSSTSVDGLHSLRLVTATANNGYQIGPYPVSLKVSSTYTFSFWAMGSTAGLKLQFSFSYLSPTSATFETATQWKSYSMKLTATQTIRTGAIHYSLASNGTVWIDLLQLTEN